MRFLTDSHSDEWEDLDWAAATKNMASYASWEGCPVQSVDGAHFLGHGSVLLYRFNPHFIIIRIQICSIQTQYNIKMQIQVTGTRIVFSVHWQQGKMLVAAVDNNETIVSS